MSATGELAAIHFASRDGWSAWLALSHETSPGLWLKIAKSESGVGSVSYAEAVEVAICYGWIDGQKNKLDDNFWLQRFTRRRSGSRWSKLNCAKAAELIATGEMKPAGQREVDRAKADGRWDAAYEAPSKASVPEDLQRELDRDPTAAAFFATLDSRNRYAVLYRIQDAKKPDTRARRIEKFVAMLSEQKKIYP
jgi:uncharacterized protein YdeI (YjbR/CyaY-like superfamily)